MHKTFTHPRALDATQQDAGHKKWVGLIQQLAQDVTVRVEAMVKKNPAEWEKDGKMPEGCEYLCCAPWRMKMAAVLERALLRTLMRQPVVRVDM